MNQTVDTLEDLFTYQLREMYYIETELVDVLDAMASDATDERVAEAFAEHREETREHVNRLGRAFDALQMSPEPQESAVFDGLLAEREQFLDSATNEGVVTPYLIGAGIKTERMEITGYESLLELADELDYPDDVVDPLSANLDEEQNARQELSALGEGSKIKELFSQIG